MNDTFTVITLFLLAFIPTIVWFRIFHKENPERFTASIFAIIAWWLSTFPVLFYQKFWWYEWNFIFFKIIPINFQDNIISFFWFSSFALASSSAVPWGDYFHIAALALFSAFLWVWFIEEFFKHIVINPRFVPFLIAIALSLLFYYTFVATITLTSILLILFYIWFVILLPKFIKYKSIDDIISISILSAVWFSFVENMIYFWYKYESLANLLEISSIAQIWLWDLVQFLSFVFIRVSVVTMIHVLCSWVFWYHFWLAHFAKPELIQEIRDGRKHAITDFLHKLLRTSEEKIFMVEQILLALFISILLHWIYDLVVQVNSTIFWISLIVIVMPLYFCWGFVYLFKLLEDKNNKAELWTLVIKEEYV